MISVVILAKNSDETIAQTLDACRCFPEVVLYDTGSTDQTLEIAKKYSNVKIVEKPFEGFGPSHNRAAEEASHDWVLSIDSDEVPSPELLEEIQGLALDQAAVYSLFRSNFFR